MINLVNNIFNYSPDWRSISSVKQGVANAAQSVFSTLKDQTPHLLPGLLALGYDIGMGSSVGDSVTVGLAVGSLLNYKFDLGTKLIHLAALLGGKQGAQVYLSLGLPIDLPQKNGNTLLHLASLTSDLEMVRFLIEKGANPYLKSQRGNTAFSLTKNVSTLLLLMRAETHPAFACCKTIHDVYEILFPPCLYNIPGNSKELIAKLPPQSLLVELEKEGERLKGQKFSSIEEMAQKLKVKERDVVPIEQVLNILLQHNPLFKKAWELANQLGSLTVKEGKDDDFKAADGSSLFLSGKGAKYNSEEHLITVNKNACFGFKINSIVFEIINAIQRKSFQAVSTLAICGQINREEFAFLAEFIEGKADVWRQSIYASMGVQVKQTSWAVRNTLSKGAAVSHTNAYRLDWDVSCADSYFASHPEFLRKRLSDLE